MAGPGSVPPKRKEIYKYEAPWTVFSMNWSVRPDKRFRLALGSFVEEYNNKVQVITKLIIKKENIFLSQNCAPLPTRWITAPRGSWVQSHVPCTEYKGTTFGNLCTHWMPAAECNNFRCIICNIYFKSCHYFWSGGSKDRVVDLESLTQINFTAHIFQSLCYDGLNLDSWLYRWQLDRIFYWYFFLKIVSLDEESSEFSAKSTFDHPYPTTKIMWIPDSKGIYPDLLATSGDYLRVWKAGEPETRYIDISSLLSIR